MNPVPPWSRTESDAPCKFLNVFLTSIPSYDLILFWPRFRDAQKSDTLHHTIWYFVNGGENGEEDELYMVTRQAGVDIWWRQNLNHFMSKVENIFSNDLTATMRTRRMYINKISIPFYTAFLMRRGTMYIIEVGFQCIMQTEQRPPSSKKVLFWSQSAGWIESTLCGLPQD